MLRQIWLGILWGAVAPADLVVCFSLVSILQAGDWLRLSTLSLAVIEHMSLVQICHRILCIKLSWSLVSSQFVGKCQTLTCIQSCSYFRLLGHSSPIYQTNSSPVVCVVLGLDSWNCCSGKQGSTAHCLPQCLHPIASLDKRKWNLLFSCIKKIYNLVDVLDCQALLSRSVVPTV